MKTILVTGGMWFIGSHTVVALIDAWYTPIIFDNLSNSFPETLDAIQTITGVSVKFVHWDIRNTQDVQKVFYENTIHAVMHFAALKSVGESCQKPWLYFENNIWGLVNIVNSMVDHKVAKIIFSWSATVYGDASSPVDEAMPVGKVTNPYGTTKRLGEELLKDYAKFSSIDAISLRYFNPIGAHPTGLLGEKVPWVPSNIFPYIMKVLSGEQDLLKIFGGDYPTIDGTGVRDYIDIMDLVEGHIAALKHIQNTTDTGTFDAINLWTWKGTSVLALLRATEKWAWKSIAHEIVARREGDVAEVFASVDKAKDVLWWQAQYTIHDSIRNTLKFISHIQTPGLS